MKASKHFRKQMAFNMFFVLITILIVGIIAIVFTVRFSVSQYRKDMEEKSLQVSSYINSTLDDLNRIQMQVSLFKWVSEYTNKESWKDEIPTTELRESINDTVRLKAVSPIIKNIAIALPSSSLVIADYGVQNLSQFWRYTFEKELNLSSPYLSQRNYARFYFLDSVPTMSNTALFIKPISAEKEGNIFIFIDKTRMNYELSNLIGNDAITVHIYDRDQEEVITNGSSTFTFAQMPTFARDNHLYLYRSEIGSYDWTSELLVPEALLNAYIVKNIGVVALIILFLLIASIPASYFLALHNYRPIKRLMSIPGKENMEFEAFLNAIKVAFASESQREQNMALYQPLLRTSLLNELASDSSEKDKILRALSDIGVELPYSHLLMVAFTPVESDFSLQVKDENIRYYLLSYKDMTAIYLINGSIEVLERVKSADLNVQNDKYYTSISQIHPFPSMAKEAEEEIKTTLQYRNTDEGSTTLEFSQITKENLLPDFTILPSLRNAIKQGKSKECRALINDFFYTNITGAKPISYIDQIHSQLIKLYKEIAKEDQIHPSSIDELDKWDINQCDSITNLMETSLEVALQLTSEENEIKELSSRKELNAILSYLDSHIYDPSLSLSLLSEEFKSSESRISRQIKLITGSNFLDYVNKKRIAKAEELLLANTDTNINIVALQVGYSNDITFRRLFKKFNGVSPGEYRTLKG